MNEKTDAEWMEIFGKLPDNRTYWAALISNGWYKPKEEWEKIHAILDNILGKEDGNDRP